MLGLDRKAASCVWTAILIVAGVYALYEIREPLFVLIVSILFAYVLYPLVALLNRALPSKSREPALAITYLLLVAVLLTFGFLVGSRVVEQATALVARAPQIIENLNSSSPNIPLPPYLRQFKLDLIGEVQNYLKQHYSDIVSLLPSAGMKVLSLSSYLLFVVLVPIISFFLLKDAGKIRDYVLSAIPEDDRRVIVQNILDDTHVLLGQYVRAVTLLCLATFVVFSIVFAIMQVPYGILLAAIAFPLEFIPLVGPLAAAVIIVLVTIATGYSHVFAVIVFLGVYRLFQDYVLTPRLMSEGVEMHPLLVILGVLAGERLAGIPGMFLSIPVIAFARVFVRRISALASVTEEKPLVRLPRD